MKLILVNNQDRSLALTNLISANANEKKIAAISDVGDRKTTITVAKHHAT